MRIRSRGTDRRWRRSQPLCSSTRSAVIRYRVVRQRTHAAEHDEHDDAEREPEPHHVALRR